MPIATPLYQPDLARVHNDGFAFHCESAAPAILKWLHEAKIHAGTVVDLGCGGGQWLAQLTTAGYSPVGVDVSPAMIRMARQRVPRAKLACSSFADANLPPCDAVTSLGEPLNYLSSVTQFRRTLKNVARALRPGGLFIFDVRVPAAKPVEPRVVARIGDNWTCIARIQEDTAGHLTRRITTFRQHGRGYRRSEETHTLRLYPKAAISAWLNSLGFEVRTTRSYGHYRLGPRQYVFIGRIQSAPKRTLR